MVSTRPPPPKTHPHTHTHKHARTTHARSFAEQALNTTDLAKVKGGLEVVVLLAILISATRWTSETVVVDGPKEKTKSG